MSDKRRLLIQLLNYIEEQAKVFDPKKFNLDNLKTFCKYRKEIEELPGVQFDLSDEGDHIWLKIDRLQSTKPPKPDEKLASYIRISDDPSGKEPYLEMPINDNAQNSSLGLDNLTAANKKLLEEEIEEVFEKYLKEWKAWADEEKQRRCSIDLYGDLFSIKHQIEAEEAANPIEFLWGIGLATWKLCGQEDCTEIELKYPILTQQLEIDLDETTMALYVRPRSVKVKYEGDIFSTCLGSRAVEVEKAVQEMLSRNEDCSITPFDISSYQGIMKLCAATLDSGGKFQNRTENTQGIFSPSENLTISDEWVIFTRPRSHSYMIDDLKRLKKSLEEDCEIPEGPAALVTIPSGQPTNYRDLRFRGISSRGKGNNVEELFFPLPYNDEQITIMNLLEQNSGVVVQGPPGTGKTHTIANIICHYLAKGKRVLVTSKGDTALKVLQDKIPDEVRPLTVALLTSDREGLKQFEYAINTIQAKVSQLNPNLVKDEINDCKEQLNTIHAALAAIEKRIDEIAYQHLSEIEIDGMRMNAQKMADFVIHGEAQYSWFDDDVTLDSNNAPPLSEDEVENLRKLRRKIGNDLPYLKARIPQSDKLLKVSEVTKLHYALLRKQSIDEQIQNGEVFALKSITNDVLQEASNLLFAINNVIPIHQELNNIPEAWPYELRRKFALKTYDVELSTLVDIFKQFDSLEKEYRDFLIKPVSVPEGVLNSAKARKMLVKAALTGKLPALSLMLNNDIRNMMLNIKVQGKCPENNDDWAHVLRYVEFLELLIGFSTRWNQIANLLDIPTFDCNPNEIKKMRIVLAIAERAQQLAKIEDPKLLRMAEMVFAKLPTEFLDIRLEALNKIKEQLQIHLDRANLANTVSVLSNIRSYLANKSGQISNELKQFFNEIIGNKEYSEEQIVSRYSLLLNELIRVEMLKPDLDYIKGVANRIEKAGAPNFATRICETILSQESEDFVLPRNWQQAWTWARLKNYLQKIDVREKLKQLFSRRDEYEKKLSMLYRQLVSKSAWLATKANATPKVLQALQGYANAIRRIGRGTGPNAIRYRRDAREHMTQAAEVVPCWIMNHMKVSESMPPEIGCFDLVIVDEASQSDLWALPAIIRGKKILVVGDDKQVSPDGGFIAAQRINELRNRFLEEQPYKEDMTPEKSLYDLASRVFAAQQVMLREHFRCVSPIIDYSNKEFYNGAIQPLRIPKASERIDPPLVDIYLEGGTRDHRDCNRLEAEYIAREIGDLISDKRFIGRTIGVISLLGNEQAKYIDNLVRGRCDVNELLHRRFDCGDARTFQGSERDIIFLSMVVDRKNCRALTSNTFQQRFNVAASRARDRLYLVRSVQPWHLSPNDLRLGLIKHFDSPSIRENDAAELIHLCESEFERQVFRELTQRGYRVIPQVKTGAYRIDLVVEGANDVRLAIECDGDEFHDVNRWQHDMMRQKVLERAGWIFWRCFASTWKLHRKEIIEELIERLNSMGIQPIGAIESIPLTVEKRCYRMNLETLEMEELRQNEIA